MKKYLKNMVPIGTIDKNPVYFDNEDSSLNIIRKKTSFLGTACSSLIMIIYVIIGRVNSKYYLTILGRYQFLMIGILISFITAFVVCYATFHREREVEKLQLEEKSNEELCVKRAKKCLLYLFISYHIPTNDTIFCTPLYHIWQYFMGSCFSFIYDYIFYVLL